MLFIKLFKNNCNCNNYLKIITNYYDESYLLSIMHIFRFCIKNKNTIKKKW